MHWRGERNMRLSTVDNEVKLLKAIQRLAILMIEINTNIPETPEMHKIMNTVNKANSNMVKELRDYYEKTR